MKGHGVALSGLTLAIALALAGSVQASSMVMLEDDELSGQVAQDGLVMELTSNGLSIANTLWTVDPGTANEAALLSQNLTLNRVDATGATVGGPLTITSEVDIGSNGTIPGINFGLELSRSRLRVDNVRQNSDLTRSYGSWVLDAEGSLRLVNREGLFNNNSNNTFLRGELRDAKFYYRQNALPNPYIVMNDLAALWEMPAGTLSLTSDGIRMATGPGSGVNRIQVTLDFDLLFKVPGLYGETAEFYISGNEQPIFHFGWIGSVKNAELIWRTGGVWNGTTASGVAGVGDVYNVSGGKTGGLWFSSRWDFVNRQEATAAGQPNTEFRWELGEAKYTGADKSRVNFSLGDWAKWGSNAYSHDFPLIAIDVVNPGQGPGGLCWGFAFNGPTTGACSTGSAYNRQFINLAPGNVDAYNSHPADAASTTRRAAALVARGGNLQSYSRALTLKEYNAAGVATNRDFKWGLIYTFANVDANMYFYPGGSASDLAGGSISNGVIADVMLMSQTFGAVDNPATATVNETYTQGFNWNKGTHLMIADTDINKNNTTGEARDAMGIGLVSTNFLFLLDDTRIWLKNYSPSTNTYDGGIDLLSKKARINIKTFFGGGVIPPYGVAGEETVKGAFINLNLEGLINFRMSPPIPGDASGKQYLAYSGAIRGLDFPVATTGANFAAVGCGVGGTSNCGTFLSLAEPSDTSVDFRLANITGDVAITNGRMDLRSSTEDGDGKPKLVISQTLNIGADAATRLTNAVQGTSLPGAAAGQVLRINNVDFSGKTLGRIVIPNGRLSSSLTLKPQI